MSRMSYKIHDVRNDVANCCPLCSKPWQPPEGLTMYHGLLFWEEKELKISPLTYQCLVYFLQNLGKVVAQDRLFFHLYGEPFDGGPHSNIINVSISKLRRLLREEHVPLAVHCVNKIHGGPSHFIMTEVVSDGRHHTPQRPKIVHSR